MHPIIHFFPSSLVSLFQQCSLIWCEHFYVYWVLLYLVKYSMFIWFNDNSNCSKHNNKNKCCHFWGLKVYDWRGGAGVCERTDIREHMSQQKCITYRYRFEHSTYKWWWYVTEETRVLSCSTIYFDVQSSLDLMGSPMIFIYLLNMQHLQQIIYINSNDII